jgi:group I intron endonuclease
MPWPRNPRRINKEQAKRLVESFDQFGQVETIAIGPGNEVYNGHQRLAVLAQQHGVYLIENSLNGHKYVGSSRDLNHRRMAHLYHLRAGKHQSSHMQRAFDKYGEAAFVFRVLVVCETSELLRYEQHFLDSFHPEYNNATVAANRAGWKHTEEWRANKSASQTGSTHTEAARVKISLAQKGKPETEEARRKNSECHLGKASSMKGKHHTAEANDNNRVAHIGRTASPATREKISAAISGRTHSEETIQKMRERVFTEAHREKISASLKGRPLSDECRRKLSAAHMGSTHTEETRRAMSLAQRKRWSAVRVAQT